LLNVIKIAANSAIAGFDPAFPTCERPQTHALNHGQYLREYIEKYSRARQATDDNIIRRMRIAYWITKATNMHSEYVIFIHFLLQQWLRERTSTLHYIIVSCLFNPHVDLFTGLLIAL
jgi:hypothetical protein